MPADGGACVTPHPGRTTQLMYACSQGDLKQVQRILLEQPTSLRHLDRTQRTPLHYCAGGTTTLPSTPSVHPAARLSHCADLLLMAAPDLVHSRDQDGFTPLHLAVIAGNVQLVQFLLANGADVKAKDGELHSVVHWATVCGETAALQAVLAAGAEVSTPDVHGGFPLHYAAQMCGSEKPDLGLQVLHILLSSPGIKVSVTDNDGRQPLLWAASAGSARAVLALVRAGAAVEASDRDGLTALHCAASRGHTDTLDTLLTLCGAQTDVIDSNGCTALHYSVTLGHADATALLLSHSADSNLQDRKGRSPAHCGCAKGQLETVRQLHASGANLWLRTARGDLPLHEAAASGRRQLVRWLLDQRPSQVNARNNDGRGLLHLAALNDNADMCKILLDSGAAVNPLLRTSKNVFMTPLDCALQRGFRSTAKFLQLHGGVPANRLNTLRLSSELATNVTSGSHLHIRDDITIFGGSSSETDLEEIHKSKDHRGKRKTVRRKLSYRHERRRSLSPSEPEVVAAKSSSAHDKARKKYETKKIRKKKQEFESEDTSPETSHDKDRKKHIPVSDPEKSTSNREKRKSNNVPIEQEEQSSDVEKQKQYRKSDKSSTVKTIETSGTTEQPMNNETEEQKAEKNNQSSDVDKQKKSRKSDKTSTVKTKETSEMTKQPTNNETEEQKAETTKNHSSDVEKQKKSRKSVKSSTVEPKETSGTIEQPTTIETEDQKAEKNNQSSDVEKQKKSRKPDKSSSVETKEVSGTTEQPTNNDSEDQKKSKNKSDSERRKKKSADKTSQKDQPEEPEVKQPQKSSSESKSLSQEDSSKLEEPLQTATKSEESKSSTEDTSMAQQEPDGLKPAEEDLEQSSETIQPDQISLQSKLSEESPSKTIVVEAAVHHPPKGISAEDVHEEPPDVEKETKDAELSKEVVEEPKIETETVEEAKQETEAQMTENGTEEVKPEEVKTEEIKPEVKPEEVEPEEVKPKVKPEEVEPEEVKLEEAKEELEAPVVTEEVPQETVASEDKETTENAQEVEEKVEEQIPSTSEEPKPVTVTEESSTAETKETSETTEQATTNETEDQKDEPESKKELNIDLSLKKFEESAEFQNEATDEHENTKQENEDESKQKKYRKKVKISKVEQPEKEAESSSTSRETSTESESEKPVLKEHKSFKILKNDVAFEVLKDSPTKETRRVRKTSKKRQKESERLNESATSSPEMLESTRTRSKSVPRQKESTQTVTLPSLVEKRPESNLSAPNLSSVYSDNEQKSGSNSEVDDLMSSASRKRRIKRRSKLRVGSKSAGSDYESSNLIDSGFEPSPRSSRIPKRKVMSERGVNMTSVTQQIQSNIRKYHMERKIFQHLLDLKRLQIRSGQANESVLVKRAIDTYHNSVAASVGAGRYMKKDYTYKSFEQFLYQSLRMLQKSPVDHLKGLPETTDNPLLCTQSTHRCLHATHAYTGIPCAAYLPKMNHHTMPKIGFTPRSSSFLPQINSKGKSVTLELCHGNDKQVISLPADRLDHNKRYYVTFTVKGQEGQEQETTTSHRHAKSV